jgi:hypothetical protein
MGVLVVSAKIVLKWRLESSGSGQEPLAVTYEHGTERLDSLIDKLRKMCVLRSVLLSGVRIIMDFAASPNDNNFS